MSTNVENCQPIVKKRTKEDSSVLKDNSFSKGFQIINFLNNNLLIFSLKALNPSEKESVKKLGVFLQGFYLTKNDKKKSIIYPINLWDYQKLDFFQGKIENGVRILLSILKRKLIFS